MGSGEVTIPIKGLFLPVMTALSTGAVLWMVGALTDIGPMRENIDRLMSQSEKRSGGHEKLKDVVMKLELRIQAMEIESDFRHRDAAPND